MSEQPDISHGTAMPGAWSVAHGPRAGAALALVVLAAVLDAVLRGHVVAGVICGCSLVAGMLWLVCELPQLHRLSPLIASCAVVALLVAAELLRSVAALHTLLLVAAAILAGPALVWAVSTLAGVLAAMALGTCADALAYVALHGGASAPHPVAPGLAALAQIGLAGVTGGVGLLLPGLAMAVFQVLASRSWQLGQTRNAVGAAGALACGIVAVGAGLRVPTGLLEVPAFIAVDWWLVRQAVARGVTRRGRW